VGVPAKIAGPVIAEAIELHFAEAIQVISAGFAETKAGESIKKELVSRLEKLNEKPERRPVINGPNTLGNIYHNMNTVFTARYKSSGTGKGRKNAALLCQSGAYLITRISDLANVVSPEIGISVGNQMDLSVTDFLEYMLDEKGISTYGLYIEGLKPSDGLRLMELTAKARSIGRFVVIYKVGRTAAGMEAAKGHTAAMAGDYQQFASMMRMAGGIVVDTPVEFNDMIMMTALSDGLHELTASKKKHFGVAALSNAGFEKCMIADHLAGAARPNFGFAKYSTSTVEALNKVLAEQGVASIVDQTDILDLSPMTNDDGYEKIVRATLADAATDIGIYSFVPETVMLNVCEKGEGHREDFTAEGSLLNRMIGVKKGIAKPFVMSVESGWKYDKLVQAFIDAGIPCFRSADAAARSVAMCLEALI
jgi:acyl-CoA synthetase (NDP forming)